MKKSLFPSSHEALITACILSFLVGLVVSAAIVTTDLEWSDYVSGLIALVAAFSGAWLAFHLTNLTNQRQERSLNIMGVNTALFVLMRQINAIEGIARDIEGYESDENLAFEMPGKKPNSYRDLRQDFNQLAFIASSKFAQDLFHLTIEQERFEQVLEAVSIRNESYVDRVMPAMVAAGLTDRKATLQEYKQKLDPSIYKVAMQGAIHMREEVLAFRESSVNMHKQFYKVAKELYPGQEFLQVAV